MSSCSHRDYAGPTELEGERPAESEVRPRGIGPFRVGQIVGEHYEVVKVLGVGGMNVVYEARDLSLSRVVALKAPLLDAYAPALLREAEALAAVRGPSFISVFTVAHEGTTAFVVMERLFGETLEVRVDELRSVGRNMPISEVVKHLVAITAALADAHARGITHRDLKPSNVMLTAERTVLIDLGVFVPEALVSPDNDVAGSIRYMAPEVILRDVVRGEGPLVDLYALGIIAYELLTHSTPFPGASAVGVVADHLSAPVPDVRSHRADVPGPLAVLVSSLLEKKPSARPPGAEFVLWQLREIARNVGDAAPPSSEAPPRAKVASARRPRVAA